jgi:hypothetical protein
VGGSYLLPFVDPFVLYSHRNNNVRAAAIYLLSVLFLPITGKYAKMAYSTCDVV